MLQEKGQTDDWLISLEYMLYKYWTKQITRYTAKSLPKWKAQIGFFMALTASIVQKLVLKEVKKNQDCTYWIPNILQSTKGIVNLLSRTASMHTRD